MNPRSHRVAYLATLFCVVFLASGLGRSMAAADTRPDVPADRLRDDGVPARQANPVSTLNWYIQTVGAPAQKWLQEPGARFVAADAAGNLHVAYGGDHLYYGRYDGSAWHLELVDGADAVGTGASLALDSRGYPHISYCDQANRTVKVAAWQGVAWEIRPLIDAGWCSRTSLALDAADMPSVAWVTDEALVKYAAWDGREWAIRTVGDGRFADLALDAAGRPHIVHDDSSRLYGPHDIFHTWYDGVRWQSEPLQALPGAPGSAWSWTDVQSLALAAGPQGDLRVAYVLLHCTKFQDCRTGMGYARRTDDGWVFAPKDEFGASTVGSVALAVDPAGQPYISYQKDLNVAVRRWTGDGWAEQVIESFGDWRGTWQSAITFDGSGLPHIGYLNPGSGSWNDYSTLQPELRRATLREGAWVTEQVDRAREAGLRGSLALDAAGDPRLSYRAADSSVLYASWANGHWQVETVDAAQGAPFGRTALALDGSGTPHIGYISTACTLNHAQRTPAGWEISVLPMAVCDGFDRADLALAVDREGNPQLGVASSCGSSGFDRRSVKYARWTGESWQVTELETMPCSDYEYPAIDLALAADDVPHLLYRSESRLRYAHWTGNAWTIQDVDHGLGWESSIALALDRSGNPSVGYATGLGESTTALRYAALTEGGWRVQMVAAGDIRSLALKLDAAGAPHLSYYHNREAVRYSSWNEGAWTTQTVAAFPTSGALTVPEVTIALALDRNDRPRISYHDPTFHSARLATGSPLVAAADCGPAPAPGAAFTGTLPASGIVTQQISDCLDDAHVALGLTTELFNGSQYVRMGGRAGLSVPYVPYEDGLLFRDVRVPQGAEIISATLRVVPWYQAGVAVAEVAGELSPQAADFRAANPWPFQRPKTSQRVPWIVAGVVHQSAESPDLDVIVEEIVGQDAWQPGNNLALLIRPVLTERQYVDWQAYDFSPANAAQLTIGYRVPGGPTVTPTVTPTATPSATSTATPRPSRRVYLPLLLR